MIIMASLWPFIKSFMIKCPYLIELLPQQLHHSIDVMVLIALYLVSGIENELEKCACNMDVSPQLYTNL